MTDYAITASQVVPVAGYQSETRLAAVAITAGKSLYINASNQWALTQCDGTALEATFQAIALNDGGAGQPVTGITGGLVNLGAAAAVPEGMLVVLSRTGGGLAPSADLLATDRVTVVGYGAGTNQVQISKIVTGKVKP